MIRFENVTKRYDTGHQALTNVSVDIAKDDMAFLTGHSGAGKSTLLKLIMMMERPSQGEIIVNDLPLNTCSSKQVPFHRRCAEPHTLGRQGLWAPEVRCGRSCRSAKEVSDPRVKSDQARGGWAGDYSRLT